MDSLSQGGLVSDHSWVVFWWSWGDQLPTLLLYHGATSILSSVMGLLHIGEFRQYIYQYLEKLLPLHLVGLSQKTTSVSLVYPAPLIAQ